MAVPVTPMPPFPNVPQAPGVPPVLRQIGQVQNDIVLLAADAVGVLNLFATPQWGLYLPNGKPALGTAAQGLSASGIIATVLQTLGAGGQSVGGVEYRLDHRIATAPQEQGAFLSYNKVSTPFSGRVTYIIGGTAQQRGIFLAKIELLQQSLDLINLVMPEISYFNCNVVHHDFRRTAKNGITMFEVDVWVEEVRVTGTAAFSNTQQPGGADPVNGGSVQPQPPSASQAAVNPLT